MEQIPRIPEDDLYDDLERSLEESRVQSRKKSIMIFGGVVMGLGLVYYFSYIQPGQHAVAPKPTPVKSAPAPKPIKPVEVGRSLPQPVAPSAGDELPAKPQEENKESLDPANVEKRLAALNEMNLIHEDISATQAAQDEALQPKPLAPPEPPSEPEPVAVVTPQPKVEKIQPPQQKAPEPAPAVSFGGGDYTVQVIATTDALLALETRDKLSAAGYQPWIATGSAKKDIYRVEVGVYNSIREAGPVSARMTEAGFSNRVAYMAGGKLATLLIGTSSSEADAKRLASRATAAGFDARVRLRSDAMNMYMVRVGKYRTSEEARDAMLTIRKSGFHPEGVTK